MPAIFVTATVPAAARPAAEAAIAEYLQSPTAPGAYIFGVPLVAYPGDPESPVVTAYGTCASMSDTGSMYAALGSIAALFPGSSYQVVSPWRTFRNAVHWIAWLNSLALQPQRTPM